MKWLWVSVFTIACSSSTGGVDAGVDAGSDAASDASKSCGATLVLDSACTAGDVCAGPTIAKQCDGTTAQVNGGDCTCSSTGWTCSGITVVTCAPDSGASDAAGD